MNRFLVVALAVSLSACASFQTRPGARPPRILPREPVIDYTMSSRTRDLYVSVVIDDGDWRGWCGLPDASNTIACTFTYGGLETSTYSISYEGYRHLSPQGARLICSEALWSVGVLNTRGVIEACARRLMEYRWIEDADHFVDPEAAYREP